MFTVKGEDLNAISQIFCEINFENSRRCLRSCNPNLKPFLQKSPMTRTKDFNGIGTLTIRCADLTCFWDVIIAVEDAFYVNYDPGQKYSGTIDGMRPRGPMASSALVSSYEWPISNVSPATPSSAEAHEMSKLKI